MDEINENIVNKKVHTAGLFSRFNGGLAYWLNNIFKFIWTIFKFFFKLSGLMMLAFPFVFIGMCLIAPDSALATFQAIAQFLQFITNIFK